MLRPHNDGLASHERVTEVQEDGSEQAWAMILRILDWQPRQMRYFLVYNDRFEHFTDAAKALRGSGSSGGSLWWQGSLLTPVPHNLSTTRGTCGILFLCATICSRNLR